MPNWVRVKVTIKSENVSEVMNLNRLMSRIEKREKPFKDMAPDEGWLTDLATELEAQNTMHINFGTWNSRKYRRGVLTFNEKCAYAPTQEVYPLILKKYPSLKISWYAEELQSEIYCTNDREVYPAKYILYLEKEPKARMSEILEYYVNSEKEAVEVANKELKKNFSNVEELRQFLENQKSIGCALHEIVLIETNYHD